MLTYNTHLKPLVLPEYGRVIQKMVDYALTIEDREERTRCAFSIIKAMKTILQTPKDEDVEDRKYWDHLAIMSGFALDIDWPYEVLRPESIESKPEPIPYEIGKVNNRQYGRNLINMIDATSAMEPGPDRDAIIVLVANQMKKASLAWDPDGYSDERIFDDIARITEGQIVIHKDDLMLCDFKDAPKPGKKKKKK